MFFKSSLKWIRWRQKILWLGVSQTENSQLDNTYPVRMSIVAAELPARQHTHSQELSTITPTFSTNGISAPVHSLE